MALLSRDDVKSVVGDALHVVADFDSDFEAFDFSKFQDYHKFVCINEIANRLAQQGIAVALSVVLIGTMKNIGALVDYVTDRQVRQSLPKPKVSLP